MTQPDFTGYYKLATFMVEIRATNDGLTSVLPGTPPGFDVKLVPTDQPHTFRVSAGQMAGTVLTFQVEEDGMVTGLVAGEHTLARQDGPPVPSDVPSGQGLRSPELVLDDKKEAAFAALVAQIETQADGAVLTYDLPYPKYEFLMYAAQQDKFIFHGSGKGDIDRFVTQRTSMELNDRSGRGNVQGIYGTHDGLWPLFFAVVDRSKIQGTIRNGVNYFQNDAGDEVAIYNFSINKDHLAERPYRAGTLYILPRDTFQRMPATGEGGLSNEWVSQVPVRPLARLTIQPEEFPFLAQIGGHDDSELIAMQTLGKQVYDQAQQARMLPDGFSVKLDWQASLAQMVLDYIPRLQAFIPTARLALRFEPDDGVWLDFFGPPAVNSVMINSLREGGMTFTG